MKFMILLKMPLIKGSIYLFTVAFHGFLLVRSLFKGWYLFAAILLIPVVAVSVAFIRLIRQVRSNKSGQVQNGRETSS